MNMTQKKWGRLSRAERAAVRDNSDLHPLLIGLEGKRVRVTPKRAYGRSTFRVGITAGWRPAHLAMRTGARGSSDLIGAGEVFSVHVLPD
jgi:hypothetical protein